VIQVKDLILRELSVRVAAMDVRTLQQDSIFKSYWLRYALNLVLLAVHFSDPLRRQG